MRYELMATIVLTGEHKTTNEVRLFTISEWKVSDTGEDQVSLYSKNMLTGEETYMGTYNSTSLAVFEIQDREWNITVGDIHNWKLR